MLTERAAGTSSAPTARSSLQIARREPGTAYSRQLTVPAQGAYSVKAFHYRAGKLVKKSAARLLRCRSAHHHRLDGQRVDGARTRRLDGPRGHAAGHRLHDPFGLGLGRPGVALRRRALHLGRLRQGRRRRAWSGTPTACAPAATTGCATRCPSGAPAPWSSPSRSTSTRPAGSACRRSRTAVPAGGHLLRRCQRRGHGL